MSVSTIARSGGTSAAPRRTVSPVSNATGPAKENVTPRSRNRRVHRGPARPAVEHGLRADTALLDQPVDLGECVPAMDDDRLDQGEGEVDLLAERPDLRLPRSQIAIEVEAGLPHRIHVTNHPRDRVPLLRPELCIMRMEPCAGEGGLSHLVRQLPRRCRALRHRPPVSPPSPPPWPAPESGRVAPVELKVTVSVDPSHRFDGTRHRLPGPVGRLDHRLRSDPTWKLASPARSTIWDAS